MRKILAAVLALGLLIPGATPASAFTFTGNCTPGAVDAAPYNKIFVWKPSTELPTGFHIREAYGEIVAEQQYPCSGGGLDGMMAVLPANIEGYGSGQLVQLGMWRYSTYGSPVFVKTQSDISGGAAENVNAGGQVWNKGGPGFPSGGTGAVEAPEFGHRYYFWLRTVNNLVWRYEIMDLNDGEKWWRDETAHWVNGQVSWWGYEWFDEQDRPEGQHYIDDLRYKINDGGGWIWRTQVSSQIRVQCSPAGHCAFSSTWQNGEYHHWDAAMHVSDQGYGGNRLWVQYNTTP
jgi:hypothetical protein